MLAFFLRKQNILKYLAQRLTSMSSSSSCLPLSQLLEVQHFTIVFLVCGKSTLLSNAIVPTSPIQFHTDTQHTAMIICLSYTDLNLFKMKQQSVFFYRILFPKSNQKNKKANKLKCFPFPHEGRKQKLIMAEGVVYIYTTADIFFFLFLVLQYHWITLTDS